MRAAITAVLFDYGNTLMTVERPDRALHNAYAAIATRLRQETQAAVDVETLIRDVHDRVDAEFAEHQRSGALEEIDLVAAAARAYRDLGVELDTATLDDLLRLEQRAWLEGIRVDPEAAPTLDALRAAGLRVGLCSNAPYRTQSMHEQLEHVGLRAHLDAVTFSGEVGWRKPSARIFEAALSQLGAAPAQSLMVGDSLREDALGARDAGLAAVLLERDGGAPGSDTTDGIARIRRLPEVLDLLGISHEERAAQRHA